MSGTTQLVALESGRVAVLGGDLNVTEGEAFEAPTTVADLLVLVGFASVSAAGASQSDGSGSPPAAQALEISSPVSFTGGVSVSGGLSGAAEVDAEGRLMIGGTAVLSFADGQLLLVINPPTSDPGIAGAVWNNGQYLCLSTGPA